MAQFTPFPGYARRSDPVPKGRTPKQVPSILDQTPWEAGFYKFPDEGFSYGREIEYFNCGLLPHTNGMDGLITRKRIVPDGNVGRNVIFAWTLIDNKPVNGYQIFIRPVYNGENWEDPRVIWFRGSPLMSWCNFKWNSLAHQCVGFINDRRSVPRVIHPVVGGNGPNLITNTTHEKNWLWFEHDGVLRLLYKSDPHVIYDTPNFIIGTKHETPGVMHLWKYGEMRGGCPPLRVGNEYFSFFHSRTNWIPPKCRYHMGAYAFEASPPFRITRVTKKPLLSGSELDKRNLGAPVVVFPQGSVLRDDVWKVVGGSNDCQCFWIRIPHEDLLKKMTQV